jgi:hypothetical protein
VLAHDLVKVNPIPDIHVRVVGNEVGPRVKVDYHTVDPVHVKPLVERLDQGALATPGRPDEIEVMNDLAPSLSW